MNEGDILRELYAKKLIKTWYRDKIEGWTLISGLWSPFYIQLRNLPSYPNLLNSIGASLASNIKLYGTKLMGIAMAGIPIATAISLHSNIPLCYTRKLAGLKKVEELEQYVNQYGEHSLVEGEIEDGDMFVAVDDIVTKFDSKLIAIRQLEIEAAKRNINVQCKSVAVVIDRQQGASDAALHHGISLHALIKFKDNISNLKHIMNHSEYAVIKNYLEDPQRFQDPHTRSDIISSISGE